MKQTTEPRAKDPVRVLTGRLGALATHARGHTNTTAASAAFQSRFERQVDPTSELDPAERARRAEFARRDYFTRLALHRHRGSAAPSMTKAAPTSVNVGTAAEDDGGDRRLPPAA